MLPVVDQAFCRGQLIAMLTAVPPFSPRQLGSFVPAESAVLPLVDQVFCRSGCEDRTEKQASAFMTEVRILSMCSSC